MVSYSLLYAMFMEKEEPERCARFRQRARDFARDYIYWFGGDGASIAYGRSLTYRFAQGAFFAVALLAGEEVLPLPVMKGILTTRACSPSATPTPICRCRRPTTPPALPIGR